MLRETVLSWSLSFLICSLFIPQLPSTRSYVYDPAAQRRGRAGQSGLCPCCSASPRLPQSLWDVRDWARMLRCRRCSSCFGHRHSENQTSETHRISGQQEKSHMVTFNFSLYILEFKVKNKYQIVYISKNWLLSILIIIIIYFTFSYSLQLNVGSHL